MTPVKGFSEFLIGPAGEQEKVLNKQRIKFQEVLGVHFEDCATFDFVRLAYGALWPCGFRTWNALPCVGVCRDELMHHSLKIFRGLGERPLSCPGLPECCT